MKLILMFIFYCMFLKFCEIWSLLNYLKKFKMVFFFFFSLYKKRLYLVIEELVIEDKVNDDLIIVNYL